MTPSTAAPTRSRAPEAVRKRGHNSPVLKPEYRLGKRPANYGQTLPAEVLTRAEVVALLNACSRRSAGGRRMRAFIALGVRGGLRIEEMIALYPKDVDLDECTVRVLRAKGDRAHRPRNRLVVIDPPTCEIIAAWLTKRATLGISPRCPLFCTISAPDRGGKMWDSALRERLKEIAVKAGIDKRVHPHGLRHTMAYDMRVEGFDLVDIQQQLGHSRLDTTARYIDHMAPVQRIEALRARVWDPHGDTLLGEVDVPRSKPSAVASSKAA